MISDAMITKICVNGSAIGYACEIDFGVHGVTRAHTGTGDILINGNVFTGVGDIGEVGVVESVGDSNPSRVTVSLSCIPTDLLPHLLANKTRGNSAIIYLVVFTEDHTVDMYEPLVVGYVTNYSITCGSNNAVSLEIADEFELFEMTPHKYWSDESHQADYEGDKFCRYVTQMENRDIFWGSPSDGIKFRKS